MPTRQGHFFRNLLITVFAVAAPLIALHAYVLLAQRHDDLEATKRALQARVAQTGRLADNAFGRIEQMLHFLATRAELKRGDGAACLAFLRDINTMDPLVTTVGIVGLDGQAVCRAVDNGRAMSFTDRDWFKEAIKQEGPYLSAPYKGMLTGKWQVNIVHPLPGEDGQRIGLLVAAIDVGTLSERLFSTEGLPDGSVFGLVGPDGTVLAINTARQDWIGRRLPDRLFHLLLSAPSQPVEGPGLDGSLRVLAAHPLRSFQLHVGVGVARDAVMAPSEARARQSAGVALLIVAGALALAWFAARRLSRPVLSLAETARRFGGGDLSARADEGLPGEFQPLAHEFNKAIDAFATSSKARQAQAAAEAASQAKSDFLAHMSHEIRTPMNAVIGMTDLALREPLSPRVRDYLAKVHLSARNLLGIINDILDFSKIEAGKLDVEAVPFALQGVLDRVSAVVGLQAQGKRQELRISTAADVPAALLGDPLRLEQVLVNLCNNAVKFTGAGGRVALSVDREADGSLRFAVRDTGPGMTTEQQARLFQPFNQLDASTTREHGGTGLGLAICKQLVALMGGEISVRSEPGQGSEFFFSLPWPEAPALPEGTSGTPASAASPRLRGGKVLLVEDNEFNQIVAMELLSSVAGLEVSLAASGPEALALLDTTDFDLVLMDVQMPGMDGYEATRQLRARHGAALPVIAMTAFAMESDRQRCLAAGMNDFVTKPVEPDELFAVLGRWLAG